MLAEYYASSVVQPRRFYHRDYQHKPASQNDNEIVVWCGRDPGVTKHKVCTRVQWRDELLYIEYTHFFYAVQLSYGLDLSRRFQLYHLQYGIIQMELVSCTVS